MGSNGKGEAIKLTAGDIEQIGLTVPILRGIIKQCRRQHAGLDLSNRDLDTAVVGLRLLRGRIDELVEKETKYKQDPEGLKTRLASLDRLGKKLGAQLVVVADDEEDDGQGELGDDAK